MSPSGWVEALRKLAMACVSFALVVSVYALLTCSDRTPEPVKVILIVTSAANAGGLFLLALYRRAQRRR